MSYDHGLFEPPPGETINYVDPPTIAPSLVAVVITALVIVIVTFALRMWCRIKIVQQFGWDDGFMCIAATLFLVDSAVYLIMIRYGEGRHLYNVKPEDFQRFLDLWVATSMVYSLQMLSVKLSILFFYRRLFTTENVNYSWWITAVICIGYSVAAVLIYPLACLPVGSAWRLDIAPETCINSGHFNIAIGVLNSSTDVMILALPIPIVWKLALKLRQKITLSFVFALGLISCVMSVVRLKSVIVLIHNSIEDLTYDLCNINLWTTVEMSVAIVCACAPCLKPFLVRYFGFGSSAGTGPTTNRHYIRTGGTSHYRSRTLASRVHREDEIELNSPSKKTAHATAYAVRDAETSSTDRIIKGDSESEDGRAGQSGIVISTTYDVTHAAAV